MDYIDSDWLIVPDMHMQRHINRMCSGGGDQQTQCTRVCITLLISLNTPATCGDCIIPPGLL